MVVNFVNKSRHLQDASKTYMKIDSTPNEDGEASITAIKILYNKPTARLLTKVSYQKFTYTYVCLTVVTFFMKDYHHPKELRTFVVYGHTIKLCNEYI